MPDREERIATLMTRVIGRRGVALLHLPRRGPYIISPNHQSYVDPFLINGVLPYRVCSQLFFVGASEYFETPVTRWLARQVNLVPVDPDANLVNAMRADELHERITDALYRLCAADADAAADISEAFAPSPIPHAAATVPAANPAAVAAAVRFGGNVRTS